MSPRGESDRTWACGFSEVLCCPQPLATLVSTVTAKDAIVQRNNSWWDLKKVSRCNFLCPIFAGKGNIGKKTYSNQPH
jgi:hypothetical protein